MKIRKFLSFVLISVMIVSLVPAGILATEMNQSPANPVTVYLTVSNMGLLAKANDDSIMLNKAVTVTDRNQDGILTVNEALIAAHESYNTETGYVASDSGFGMSVSKLWGVETFNTMFFTNHTGISTSIDVDTVSDHDTLVASINKDNNYYADWYTFFDKSEVTVDKGESFSLNLKGHLGMAYTDEDKADTAISGVSIGTWNNGSFTALENKTTDANGSVTLSFDKAGTYYVSASGTVSDEVTVDWSTGETATVDCPMIAPGCIVVVKGEDAPYFENLQFISSAIKNYSTSYVFSPTTCDYRLELSRYSVVNLTLQKTTLYDTEKYTATAEYTDSNGEKQSVPVNSGAITYLKNIPFDESVITITLADKKDTNNQTVYRFTVQRPRDVTATIKSNGMVLVPEGRNLLAAKYNGYAEGTMFKLDENGELKIGSGSKPDTGVSSSHYAYKCFVLGALDEFFLTLTGNTAYTHLRYSVDGGTTWKELPQGGGTTEKIAFLQKSIPVTIEMIDDKTYFDNLKADKDGFADSEPTVYTVVVEKADASSEDAQILTAVTDSGDWYPGIFEKEKDTYVIVVPSEVTENNLTYTVTKDATVKLDTTVQTPDENGTYTLALTTSQKTLTVTSADGTVSNNYSFKLQKKKENYPDRVIDYLCINSQYTNGLGTGNAASPWVSLAGTVTSIGGFGGYITYYYEDGLTDNPNNKYGIDFYVYGNAQRDTSTSTKTSFFEPAQAWVSTDGNEWYALAGSAHYDVGVDWDYTVTYKKTADGKTAWSDSLGNSNDGSSFAGKYPLSSVYTMNNLAASDTIRLSGIMLPARNGNAAVSGIATDAYPVQWGYADCFVNGTKGADVNPYLDNSNFDLQANGFDLKWAVDSEGTPVDVSDKEFHYVKLVTVSNIWHPGYGEKSAEISGVIKTTPQETAVGRTSAPKSITITDGADTKTINLTENQQIYSIDVGDMKYVSVSVNGAGETDNIYINNTRIPYDGTVGGFKVTKESGTKLVRILVQNGEKEPVIYLLKMTGSATESSDLIENIKLDINGNSRAAETADGKTYTDSVGYRISSVGILPVASDDVTVTVNGEPVQGSYSLVSGENIFTVTGEKNGVVQTVTLKITRESAPAVTGKIRVSFTLLGDDIHGDSKEIHTLRNGGLDTWIPRTYIEADAPATVLDVFEAALKGKYSFVNSDGNYISSIDGLAEFANGPNSGWQYTLNGTYPSKGILEQSVKNGDVIVFHYTDDYTQEKDAGNWNSSNKTPGGVSVTNKDANTADNKETAAPETGDTMEDAAFANFTDVATGSWYRDAVAYVVKNNLFRGVSATSFEPETPMSRAMLVTVLYRLERPETEVTAHAFVDVPSGEWYSQAVTWAAELGIITGITETEFAPNEAVTREQMAAILQRYAGIKDYLSDSQSDLKQFTDSSQISDWALDSLKWAAGCGLITGTSDTTISPKDTANRAQVATILMRFCEQIVK